MQYRGQEFQYDAENSEVDAETGRKPPSAGNQYRRKRSIQATRRRSKSANQPGCGIGARRNNRWTW